MPRPSLAAMLMITALHAGAIGSAHADDASVQGARAATLAWLDLIDRGEYGTSWDAAATQFRNSVTRPAWADALQAVRPPLGALIARRETDARPASRLPGVPEGAYVVFLFDTDVAARTGVGETVTALLDTDNSWRVAGYYVR
jgi:hypothetical protein